jgi:DNA-binding MarR family transcriptional regulator
MIDSTSHLLIALVRAHRGALGPRLTELGLHPGAELALAELWRHPGITHSELADRLGVSRPTVTKLVRTLENGGYAERLGDPDDGRVSRLEPTRAGRRVRPALEQAWRDAERVTLAALTAAEAKALHRLLSRALGSGAER